MRFSKLHLENWRNFTLVDVPLRSRTFLIGANATGKSNLLDVFRFLGDLAHIKGGFQSAVADRGGVAHLRSLVARGSPAIVIDVHIADGDQQLWRYRLAMTEDNQGRPVLREEKVWKSGVLLLERPDAQDAADPELLYQTQLEQSKSNREFREIADFFNTIRYYHIVPQLVREPEHSPRVIYDPYGRDFIAQMVNLPEEIRNARLELIQNALRAAIPQFSELQVYRDSYGSPHLRAKYEHWQSEEDWQTEVDLSDGTLRLIGLLATLLEDAGPLLLEEPDISIHRDVVLYLPIVLGYNPARQVLVSTHNVDLLRDEGISPDEVLILQPAQGSTKVVVARDIDTIRHLTDAGLPVAETSVPHTQSPKAAELIYFRK